MPRIVTLLIPVFIIMIGCNSKTDNQNTKVEDTVSAAVVKAAFGKLADGREVSEFTMTNTNGVEVRVINYGGIITSLRVPDKNGNIGDVVLGYDSLSHYERSNPYFGALIGRYGNRIAKGKFTIDGKEYNLATNNGQNHLHGGVKGFDKVFWNIESLDVKDGAALRLTYNSKDMEEGYPGNLGVEVTYTLTNDDELRIRYSATTDKRTIVNLTQHTYFNLNEMKGDILSHQLEIKAERYVPVDNTLIPLGELRPVNNTPFDFTTARLVGDRINANDQQIKAGMGYDHCWVLERNGDGLSVAAILYDSISGREMTVSTTEPGIQFYSGNFLDGSNTGKDGISYKHRFGLCLETEHFPDSPNRPEYPTVILDPGKTYASETVYKFGIR